MSGDFPSQNYKIARIGDPLPNQVTTNTITTITGHSKVEILNSNLEERIDLIELEFDKLQKENQKLSLRIRRQELREARRREENGKDQANINMVLGSSVGMLAGFSLWGYGFLDSFFNLFGL